MKKTAKENPGNIPPGGDVYNMIVDALSTSRDHLFFIQVGSNDATTGDRLHTFLRKKHWRGIMVEPVNYVFKRLYAKYGGAERFILENIAIAETNGTKEFYYLEESSEDLPIYYDQLGSFSLPTILKHTNSIPDIEKRIRKTNIECITFQSLCDKHSVKSIDLIHIDTEGFDYEVLKLIDFERYKPALLIYEHKHLCEIDKAAAQKLLVHKRYEVLEVNSSDTLSVYSETLENDPWLKKAWNSWNTVLKELS